MVLASAAAILVGAAACSPNRGRTSGEPVDLTFLGSDPPDTVSPILEVFHAKHPNIRVKYENVPFDELNNVLQTRIGNEDAKPDMFMADQPRIPAMHDRGLLADLSGKVPDAKSIWQPESINDSSWDGDLVALPGRTSTNLLFYNPKLLERAGVEPPSTDPAKRWTFEELADAGAKAKAKGAPWGVFFDQADRYYQLQPLFESLGGGSGLTGEDNLTPALDTEGWRLGLEYYRDLFETKVAPRGIPEEQSFDLFMSGKVALWIGGPWWFKDLYEAETEYGIAPHPYFADGKPATPTGSWSYAVNPHSEHQDEALTFVTWLTATREGNTALFEKGRYHTPAHKEAQEAYFADLEKRAPEGASEIIHYEVENTAVSRARTPGFFEFETITTELFQDIRNGAEVGPATQRAEQKLEHALTRVRTRR